MRFKKLKILKASLFSFIWCKIQNVSFFLSSICILELNQFDLYIQNFNNIIKLDFQTMNNRSELNSILSRYLREQQNIITQRPNIQNTPKDLQPQDIDFAQQKKQYEIQSDEFQYFLDEIFHSKSQDNQINYAIHQNEQDQLQNEVDSQLSNQFNYSQRNNIKFNRNNNIFSTNSQRSALIDKYREKSQKKIRSNPPKNMLTPNKTVKNKRMKKSNKKQMYINPLNSLHLFGSQNIQTLKADLNALENSHKKSRNDFFKVNGLKSDKNFGNSVSNQIVNDMLLYVETGEMPDRFMQTFRSYLQ